MQKRSIITEIFNSKKKDEFLGLRGVINFQLPRVFNAGISCCSKSNVAVCQMRIPHSVRERESEAFSALWLCATAAMKSQSLWDSKENV